MIEEDKKNTKEKKRDEKEISIVEDI